ncbi:MAG: type II toxin-antitoxin system RelE/ParE family toxin [Casimicrobiaceae bacterium]
MAWRVEFVKGAQKDLSKLDAAGRERILRFLAERIQGNDDPRKHGEALKGPEVGRYWKYRVGDYRLVCDLQDMLMLVLVVRVGHRREIYR